MLSHNAHFKCTLTNASEEEHIPGESALKFLASHLPDDWQSDGLDVWRDGGWMINCSKDDVVLQVAMASVSDNAWYLQISDPNIPGCLMGLFKKYEPPADSYFLDLASAIHKAMMSSENFTDIRWKANGDPAEEDATAEPST